MTYLKRSIKTFLKDLASHKPAPGGGSSSALVGAVGTSLLIMVCAFTVKSPKYRDQHKKAKSYIRKLKGIKKEFEKLIDLDIKVYSQFTKIYLSYGSKDARYEKALKNITEVPLRICHLSFEAAKIAQDVLALGNKGLMSDIECALHALRASYKSAKANVKINLKAQMNQRYKVSIESQLGKIDKSLLF